MDRFMFLANFTKKVVVFYEGGSGRPPFTLALLPDFMGPGPV